MLFVLFLGGCGNQLVNQAIQDAKVALENQNYERALSLLLMASHEGAEAEIENLHYQLGYLIAMNKYLAARQLDAALLQWTELNLSPSDSRIVKDEAVRLLQLELQDAAAVLQQGAGPRDLEYASDLIQRLSTFEMFQGDVGQLKSLKDRGNLSP